MREFIYTGISELEIIYTELPLLVLDMIQSIIVAILAYGFAYLSLGILYHFGSLPKPNEPTN